MNKNNFTHNFISDPDSVAAFFDSLIEGFKKRKLTVSSEGRAVVLQPGEILEMSVESGQRKGRQRLIVSINWPEPERRKQSLFDRDQPIAEI
ncbi:MAG: amphi-Trp domain-containing protein [Deltaproteobacteria bacterium]|jgi:amphi-Trp domain-containing protein|nr:amphi-Trp domain-containing protein [Deltaproteobacteria bacterium]